jgi:hypothetical protein
LTVVKQRPANLPEPPRDLGNHGRSLWDRITSDYEIEDSGGLEMLGQACAALDRAEECREAVDHSGLLLKCKGGVIRENPAAKIELANRAFVVRTLARLGLDVEAVKPVGRPGKSIGWQPP